MARSDLRNLEVVLDICTDHGVWFDSHERMSVRKQNLKRRIEKRLVEFKTDLNSLGDDFESAKNRIGKQNLNPTSKLLTEAQSILEHALALDPKDVYLSFTMARVAGWNFENFGISTCQRYEILVTRALLDPGENPERLDRKDGLYLVKG